MFTTTIIFKKPVNISSSAFINHKVSSDWSSAPSCLPRWGAEAALWSYLPLASKRGFLSLRASVTHFQTCCINIQARETGDERWHRLERTAYTTTWRRCNFSIDKTWENQRFVQQTTQSACSTKCSFDDKMKNCGYFARKRIAWCQIHRKKQASIQIICLPALFSFAHKRKNCAEHVSCKTRLS